jgi:hypothetical protein
VEDAAALADGLDDRLPHLLASADEGISAGLRVSGEAARAGWRMVGTP